MNEYDEFWEDVKKEILSIDSKEQLLEYIKIIMGSIIFSSLEETLGDFENSHMGKHILESEWYSHLIFQRQMMAMEYSEINSH